jgi:hypothetical protein
LGVIDETYALEREFELKFLRCRGAAFQDLFSTLMERAYPGDFRRVRPHGSTGDLKCDGYLVSERAVFQVYGPDEIRVLRRLLAKIRADYEGAVQHWEGRMDRWVFVHNQDGLPAEAVQLLDDLGAITGGPRVSVWSFEQFRRIFSRVDRSSQRTLVPVPQNPPADAPAAIRRELLSAYWKWLREVPFADPAGPANQRTPDLPVRLAWARRGALHPGRPGGVQRGTSDLRPFLRTRHRLLVAGPPGSGKSTLLRRYAAREAGHKLTLPSGRSLRQTPIYVELWRWASARSVRDLLLAALTRSGTEFSSDELHLLLDGGGAVLLLDGLDEVPMAKQKDCVAEIVTLADRYPECPIVVGGRAGMAGAEQFSSVRVLPLADGDLRPSFPAAVAGRAPGFPVGYTLPVLLGLEISPEAVPLFGTPLAVHRAAEAAQGGQEPPRSAYEAFDRAIRSLVDREVETGRIDSVAGALRVISELGYQCALADRRGFPNAEWESLVGAALAPLRANGVVTPGEAWKITRALPNTWLLRLEEGQVVFSDRWIRDFCAARRLIETPNSDGDAAVAAHPGVAFFLLGAQSDARPLLEGLLARSEDYRDLTPYLQEAAHVGAVMGRFAGLAHALWFEEEVGIELSYPRPDADESEFTADLCEMVEAVLAFPERRESTEILLSASYSFCLVGPWYRSRTWFSVAVSGLHRLGWRGVPLHSALMTVFDCMFAGGDYDHSGDAFFAYFDAVERRAWGVAEERVRELAEAVGAGERIPAQIVLSPDQSG